jgi:hypothetical protein
MSARAYLAERHEIAARYAKWEIIGPPEIRDVNPEARYFNPHRTPIGNLGPLIEIVGWKRSRRVSIAGIAT